jgi:hypothetical protein
MNKYSKLSKEELLKICKIIHPRTQWNFNTIVDHDGNLHKTIEDGVSIKAYEFFGDDDSIMQFETSENKDDVVTFFYKGNLDGQLFDAGLEMVKNSEDKINTHLKNLGNEVHKVENYQKKENNFSLKSETQNAEIESKKNFTTEVYDKFNNSKEVSTLRQKKFGGWTETHEPNQSIQLYKSDFAMPGAKIDFEVCLYATAVYLSNPDGEEYYIEFLNYFKDGYADLNSTDQDFKNSSMQILIDNENFKIKSQVLNDKKNHFNKSGLEQKEIFTRNQLLKFPISKELFTQFCDGKDLAIRIIDIENPIRLSGVKGKNYHEFDSNAINSIQVLCQKLYNDIIDDKYTLEENSNISNKEEGGCFIATAAMGDYNHPTVIDLRLFRDNYLLKKSWGQKFTNWYYTHGPKVAKLIKHSRLGRKVTFFTIIKPLHFLVSNLFNKKSKQ